MILFVIRDSNGLYLDYGPEAYEPKWVKTRAEAGIYRTREEAQWGIDSLGIDGRRTDAKYEIEEIDTDAAVRVLRDLFQIHNLYDFVYDIRRQECLDWDGPQVVKWAVAVTRAEELIKQYNREHPEEVVKP